MGEKKITQEELLILELIEPIEYVDGYCDDELQLKLF